jgi:vacuolar-type H+-ATPase subunit F/Vma7
VARVAVIGDGLRIAGYGLAGAVLSPAEEPAAALHAWQELPGDIAVVMLTPRVARWLDAELAARPEVLPVVLPE